MNETDEMNEMDELSEAQRSQHRHAWDLIPWVVNGSAGAAERRVVDAHVAACDDCRAELAFQQRLHAGMADDGAAALPDPGPALQRFWGEVDAQGDVASGPRHRSAMRLLAAAVVVQAIGLAVLGGMLWERPRAADYETLSRAAAASTPAAAAATIRMVPAPALAIGELRSLLARCGVQLVDTSGDGGIFGAVLRADAPGATVEAALARLRAEPGVLLAEPIVASAATAAR